MTCQGVLRGLDYMGTCVFALSGTVTAGNAGMDLLGDDSLRCAVFHEHRTPGTPCRHRESATTPSTEAQTGRLLSGKTVLRPCLGEARAMFTLNHSLQLPTTAVVKLQVHEMKDMCALRLVDRAFSCVSASGA